MTRRNPAQHGQWGGIDSNNREARTPAARADKAWIEYYIQHKRATSFLGLAFFPMRRAQAGSGNSRLEYHLVYKSMMRWSGAGRVERAWIEAGRWVARGGEGGAAGKDEQSVHGHARSSKPMRGHASSCKVKQAQAKPCKQEERSRSAQHRAPIPAARSHQPNIKPARRSGTPRYRELLRRRPNAASDTYASARHSPAASVPPPTPRRAPATPPGRTARAP
ncbi:hypothetical protein LMG1861_02068 [Achromobacter piechaudii]|uniref:Uncharacterized protein n=1 Tax=Achromobacter piechaudii TaxID=72556 RepID=A0A6S7CPR9_9BURK|nr:hypothetical protein LMG1861_02068 [Achromobacter piechaudii]